MASDMTLFNWIEYSNADGPIGRLWTDGERFGFIEDDEADPDIVDQVSELAASAVELNVRNEVAFAAADAAVKDLGGIVAIHNTPLVAAAVVADSEPTYSLTYDDDETVRGLGYIDENGDVLVREDGEWVPVLNDEDPRYYDLGFTFVSESAVQLFDKLVQGDKAPTLSDFDGVELD